MKTPANLSITRYPPTENKSLRAWSAADEHILKWMDENGLEPENALIINDRFGYLGCHLFDLQPTSIIDYKSQGKSLNQNLIQNGLDPQKAEVITSLDPIPDNVDFAALQIPKSLELFRFYLHQIVQNLNGDGTVLCGFMTRYFSPQIIEIASEFFLNVEQSLAWKKSRVLVLKGKKDASPMSAINTISFTFKNGFEQELKQYSGVFSSNHIDYATQYLLEHVELKSNETQVLDLASGNGVIARTVQLQNPEAELHLMDDSILAIESSKLNMDSKNSTFHWSDTLDEIDEEIEFDLVVSNPPFHFAHEVNTEVAVDLFREVAGRLKPGGRFLCVANKHLGYRSSLKKFFTDCSVLAESDKFIIYECKMADSDK